ncbi:MAG: fructosamine kinase family protein [Gammaproteobacteria bacterium]|nr:fructosamine kinase family protein [Gammaproteobacteria bacterium]MDH3447409.1 fructosamine kinase family protein [Gammaproteobacteria bacterium]
MNWQSLGLRLARHLDLPPGEIGAIPARGGDINRSVVLELGEHRIFVKTNRAQLLPMFEAERAGLDAIRRSATIRVPGVYMTGVESGLAFIALEFIDFSGRPDPARLACALAAMHSNFEDRFGFECDNTIGSTPQPNPLSDDWIEFWRLHRLGYQLELARQNGFGSRLVDAGYRLAENLGGFFDDYQARPSLLHGDLWSGNQATDAAGNPVIFDPACYYGDHEADLAMMELFGHPGDRFFDVYREHFPIDAGYGLRRELYNLYHVLNHANLFGGGYAAQALRMIDGLLRH